jgi:hypothetical protein
VWTLTSAVALSLVAPVLLTAVIDGDRGTNSRALLSTPALVPALPAPTYSPAEAARPAPIAPARRTPSAALAVDPENAAAGILSTTVATRGSGKLVVVPGRERARGRGTVVKVRVEVERGLPVEPKTFARFVLRTLNDRRSWGAGGRMTFARTDGDDQDVRVVLASPDTSAALCRPLVTKGVASCGLDGRAVLTVLRWVRTTPEFVKIRTTYRHYLVNHEVGHLLGHSHEPCPRRGAVAPIMQQQTYGLKGCRPNAWPYP